MSVSGKIKKCKMCEFSGDPTLFYGRICLPCQNQKRRNHRKENKIKYRDQDNKNYYLNREKKLQIKKEYYKKNKKLIIDSHNKYITAKYKLNVNFRLSCIISSHIRKGLRNRYLSKEGKSSFNMLPYALEDLKLHLESLFEPWMTWENHGNYRTKNWDDNSSTTWTWQIDHVIPHSIFKYSSIECDEFKRCWALSNLRPLSAKQNMIKSNK